MKPTHQGLTCGSGAAAAQRGAHLPALIRGLHRRGCSRWRRCRNRLIKRHRRLSSAAIWKEKLPLFYIFFFTHCLFVSLLCFLCPLLRQQCRWIGTVSVRDLCVISWNAHPSKHKKLDFKLFELYAFSTLFHWHSASLPRSKPSLAEEIYFIWVFGVCGQQNSAANLHVLLASCAKFKLNRVCAQK